MRSALSLKVTTRLQGTDTAVWQRQTRKRNNKTDPQKSTALERSVRKLIKGFNMFDGTNLTPISDVDQDVKSTCSNMHERCLTNANYNKTCIKWPLKNRQNKDLNDRGPYGRLAFELNMSPS